MEREDSVSKKCYTNRKVGRGRELHLQGGVKERVLHLQGGVKERVLHLQGGVKERVGGCYTYRELKRVGGVRG